MTDHALADRRLFLSFLRGRIDIRGNLRPLRIVETRPDWSKGLLATAAIVLALLVIDAGDIARQQREQIAVADANAARDRARFLQLDSAPQIRLEGDGFVCRNFKIQREWGAVMARECERLAGLLRTARATE